MKTYADHEVFGGDEVVVEDGIEDGRAELACGAGESKFSHIYCISRCFCEVQIVSGAGAVHLVAVKC
jgi:hypothetical protein